METQVLDPALKPEPRRRPPPGERRQQILQCLAEMLEQRAPAITTAALAQRLQVSEAALYRHFASKAQMYEGLIGFIESSLFALVNQIAQQQASGLAQALRTVQALLAFAERNPGLSRLLTGDALAGEHARLRDRIDQLFARIEAALRQSLKLALEQGEAVDGFDPGQRAAWLLTYARGWMFELAQSGRVPTAAVMPALQRLLA